MLDRLVLKIINRLVAANVVPSEDIEIYQFGLRQAIRKILHVGMMLALGIISGLLLETMAFVLAYYFIRVYAGGFHAKTPNRCYVTTWIVILTVLLINKFVLFDNLVFTFLTAVDLTLILLFAPIDNSEKRLEKIERLVYRRKCIKILLLDLAVMSVFLYLKMYLFAQSVLLAMTCACIMVLTGMAKNVRWHERISASQC